MVELDITYMRAEFDHSSFSRSRDIIGAHQNSNGSLELTTPLSWTVCHQWASTCYDQPIYQMWSLYLHPPRRYDTRYKMSTMGWFVVCPSVCHKSEFYKDG